LGYYDVEGRLHYAGGVGSGFDAGELQALRQRFDAMGAPPPVGLLVSGDPIDHSVNWVRPEVVIEVQFTAWSGAGRVRHAVYLGVREDKAARDVVREVADPEAERVEFKRVRGRGVVVSGRRDFRAAVPPLSSTREWSPPAPGQHASRIIIARPPKKASAIVGGVELSHADRQLWPGITKQDLAEYWQAVAERALRGIAHRPLSILRCPDGIQGKEQFFQKNGHGIMPAAVREGSAGGQPYLAIDDADGLISMAQMSAIELHTWGAAEREPTKPDRLVFDLDPGEGVPWAEVVKAAHDVRDRLAQLHLTSFCRTTGGKGLHIVVPLMPEADWSLAKPFCRAFAETMGQEEPNRFLAHLKIADRRGKILVDWLRNGLGATAVASFSPRARPGATVATPVSWKEVTPKLNPSGHTILTLPKRLVSSKTDPWEGFEDIEQRLPDLAPKRMSAAPPPNALGAASASSGRRSRIVVASKPKPR
jgi:bifunctional non-homologous end joining protein LigD